MQPAREPGCGVGRERGGLLIAKVDEPDAGPTAGLVHRLGAVARDGRHEIDAPAMECLHEHIGAG
jgi:hypothetical protein